MMSCEQCHFLGSDNDGNYPGPAVYWAICEKEGNGHYTNLKSFPFKKKMPCFKLSFWFSEFSDNLTGTDKDDELFKKYREKYLEE